MYGTVNPNDPRVIKTQQLILDAFVSLLDKRDFNSITVSDITKKATINRATFYAHFPDKYALLDALLSDAFMDYIYNRIHPQAELTGETLKNLVLALCDYHEASSNRCVKNYDSVAPVIEKNIKKQLEQFIYGLVPKNRKEADKRTMELTSTMISWSIYGVTYHWNLEGKAGTPLDLAEKTVPLLSKWIISESKKEEV
jgi:AcrR family transcriptional regulator